MLPKYLQDGFTWDKGKVSYKNDGYIIETEGKEIHVNQEDGIVKVTMKTDQKFHFSLQSKEKLI